MKLQAIMNRTAAKQGTDLQDIARLILDEQTRPWRERQLLAQCAEPVSCSGAPLAGQMTCCGRGPPRRQHPHYLERTVPSAAPTSIRAQPRAGGHGRPHDLDAPAVGDITVSTSCARNSRV
jgi:hypothetical protein